MGWDFSFARNLWKNTVAASGLKANQAREAK
jgi:hypothetical protein